jgi:hypothetical protein
MATPDEQAQAMIRNLGEKTGKSLSEWTTLVNQSGLEKHGQIVTMLKSDHGITHGYANLIAHEARGSASIHAEADDLVAMQYGGKVSLRPIYDRIAEAVQAFGDDVDLSPKKTYVSLRRKKQFGLVQPSTRTRLDIGLQLQGVEPGSRLEASGSFNRMVSHRVRLTEPSEVDDELVSWLRHAYEAAG